MPAISEIGSVVEVRAACALHPAFSEHVDDIRSTLDFDFLPRREVMSIPRKELADMNEWILIAGILGR